jgi:hypothetical protein
MSDYLAREAAGDAPTREVFVESLVDAIEALLATRPSAEARQAATPGSPGDAATRGPKADC